jgi:IclR family KDG regulon transcriptional repressor
MQSIAAIAQQSFHRFTDQTLNTAAKLRSELKAFRNRDHAYDREEHEPGIICCAVPIIRRSGRVLGALSVTSATARTTLTALEALVGQVKDTATGMAPEAESWRFPEPD